LRGVNVAFRRISRLGREVLRFLLEGPPSNIYVELGPGFGRLPAIATLMGMRSFLYDEDPSLRERYDHLSSLFNLGDRLRLTTIALEKLTYAHVPEGVGVVVAERVLHFLPYPSAVRLLRLLRTRTLPGGRFFLSLSGLSSPIGEGYPGRDVPLEERFHPPRRDVGERLRISTPVCLYSAEDVRTLAEEVGGLKEISLRITDFGNVEAIYERLPDGRPL